MAWRYRSSRYRHAVVGARARLATMSTASCGIAFLHDLALTE
ncbi:hypothetical protein [Streptomyces sp. NBC_00996]|nr:hypothetical protein OG390_00270 [Streptomyces sp. NBC_00996]